MKINNHGRFCSNDTSTLKVLNLYENLREIARKNPDGIAIEALNRAPLSYQRLVGHVEKGVAQLNSFGVGRNDRVAMVIPNGPEMATAFLTVASAATCAPLNPAYRVQDFDFYLSDLDAKVLVVEEGIDSLAEEAARKRKTQLLDCCRSWKIALASSSLFPKQKFLSPPVAVD
jgi:acyl-CoA synthetase (AMP-forming)/AMP-acid ligase II